jgi:hypothetical protein
MEMSVSIGELNFEYLSSFQELEHRKIDASRCVVFLDGHTVDIESLNWHNPKLTVVLSPLIRIPRTRCLGVFRGFSVPATWSPKKRDVILLGPRYAVVPSYVAALRNSRILNARDVIKDICIFPGQKSSAAFWQVVRALCDRALRDSEVTLWVNKLSESEAKQLWKAQDRRIPIIRVTDPKRPWLDVCYPDLAITTGGQSLIEALCLGIPTIAMPEFDSQFDFVRHLAVEGACLIPDRSRISHDIRSLLSMTTERQVRQGLSRNATKAIDGHGGSRILEAATKLTV